MTSPKPSVRVVSATPSHVKAFEVDARPSDRREWEDGLGLALEVGLRRAAFIMPGSVARTALSALDGQVLAMWGVYPQGTVGIVWFAARSCARGYLHGIHHHWRAEIGFLHAFYGDLLAYTDSRQQRHVAWMQRMGFEVVQVTPRADGFQTVELIRKDPT